VSAANPEPFHLPRRRFLLGAGGLAAGALASPYLADPATAAAVEVVTNNPVITNIYTADPDAFVFDGRFYLDVDRDEAPLGVNDFVMREWYIYSSTDLVHWTDHGVRMSLATFAWANRNAWAPQMVHRDGRFYWYVPVQKAATNSMSIGVAVGDSPLGPFTDALGRPLIDNTTANHSAFDIDPTVLIDDDGQAYLYWGSFSSPRAAKLKPNMIELEDLGLGGAALGPRAPGRIGNALKLNGTSEYVTLSPGVVSGLTDFTIAAWVHPAATSTWSRVFDFGTGTTAYMFLTVNSGAGPRFAITASGNGAEQRLSRAGQLPLNTWTHLAVTLAGTTGTLYVDGVAVATNTAMTLNPASLGSTPNNWIGRAQFNDPLLNATVDDVQLYSRALTAAEVGELAAGTPGAGDVASYRFDEADGATAVDSSGNGRDATVVSPPVNVITPQGLTGFWEAPFLFKWAGIYYLAYARGHPLTGGNPATIDYATATQPFGPWTYRGRILDTVHNTTTNHAAIREYQGQWYIVYHNGMLPGGGEFRRSVCIDKLFFNDDGTIQRVVQTLGPVALAPLAWTATPVGGAGQAPGLVGTAFALDGAGQYVSLPTGMLWHMYDFTVAAWVKLGPSTGSPRIVDFGTGPNVTMYLTPSSDAGPVRFAITTTGVPGEQRVNGTAALPTDRWVHVAVSKSALVATLYVNGVQVGQNANFRLYPARLGNTPNNWVGRSQNAADPFLAGLVDDLRIYQRGLTQPQLRDHILTPLVLALADVVATQPIGGGLRNLLTVRLTQVRAMLRAGRKADAITALAGFVALVEAHRGRLLTDELATELVDSATLISAHIAASM
jgi:hypothetical protein